MKHLVLIALLVSGQAAAQTALPDPKLTPGVVNPDVTQENIQKTICKSGWTATIRPPAHYTTTLKKAQLVIYDFADHNLANYEEDHLISLELGGHPTDPKNLWPQGHKLTCGARIKDHIETHLKTLICSGKVTLAVAQQAISSNWIDAYNQYIGELKCE